MRQLWISTSGKSGVQSGRRKDCRKCRIKNHFANRCKKDAKATVESVMYFEETYQTEEILAVCLDDSQLVTLQLESVNFIRFQPDKGAQCSVLPLLVYKRASNDHNLEKVIFVHTALMLYGEAKIKVMGYVTIRVWRNGVTCLLDCCLVESCEVRPILGRKASSVWTLSSTTIMIIYINHRRTEPRCTALIPTVDHY